jgi:hypothetical protein
MFCGGRGTEDTSDLVSSMSESASSKKKGRAKRLITVQIQVKYYKRGKIRLMACFARDQRFETHFYEVDVKNGKTAKRDF